MDSLAYHHVDVFAPRPFTGNSLTVFPDAQGLSAMQMLAITRELRHFESVFLHATDTADTYRARVFDMIEELDFAGHPIIGAAGVLHDLKGSTSEQTWSFVLNTKTVTVKTSCSECGYSALLDQGRPDYLGEVPGARLAEFAAALNLDRSDLASRFPPGVVSTGLRYLILPIEHGLDRARITHRDFGSLLATIGAQFVYVLDVNALEGRHWNNDGLLEDVATGSGAGTVGAYVVRHGRIPANQEFVLQQGRFAGRPSEIRVMGIGSRSDVRSVLVGGEVARVGRGVLQSLP